MITFLMFWTIYLESIEANVFAPDTRVASSIPKIHIWVFLGGMENVSCIFMNILILFGTFYGTLVYFVVIWYI
jgi:hypothetical protein